MSSKDTTKFNNGLEIPKLGLGTSQKWKIPETMTDVVKTSIDLGYRFFDTAAMYNTEKHVGEGIRAKIQDKTITRSDVFVTTKLWHDYHHKEDVVLACKRSLVALGLDYVDLYLIHDPMPFKKQKETIDGKGLRLDQLELDVVDHVETWQGMEECIKLGLTKSIGLSNFNSKQVQKILDNCQIKPVVLQVELHPYFNQEKLINYCHNNGIVVQGYANFTSPARPWKKADDPDDLLDNVVLKELAQKHGKTVPQIILRWVIERGVIPLPKSTNVDRLKENINVFDFKLTNEEIAAINALNLNYRFFCFSE